MCFGGGSKSSKPAKPAQVAPVKVVETPEVTLGDDPAEAKKKAQEGKKNLRIPLGASSETTGAGVSSGLNV